VIDEVVNNAIGLAGATGDMAGRLLGANNESSEVFDIIKPGRRVKIKGYRQ